jgi:acyl-coenzyme A synthetase/AMP-(fatty) acid ligase
VLDGRDPQEALIRHDGLVITVGEFLALADQVAARLAAGQTVLNLCVRRSSFLAGFVAALRARCTTLLPASRAPEIIEQVRGLYPGSLVIDDASVVSANAAGAPASPARGAQPTVAPDLVAMIGFTSGSTGEPSRHGKMWRVVAASTAHNAVRICAALPQNGRRGLPWIVGTVPPQHMYGMELTVLLPLLGRMSLHGAHPLLPAEVAAALDEVPPPRILVSTPIHLRAIVASGVRLPHVEVTISATAPLDETLARTVEAATGGVLVEMFGSTETCILGSRRTATESAWQPYPGVRFSADGVGTRVEAPWFAHAERLQDIIETDPAGNFHLLGRSADLIDVAGKRASLADLTLRILRIPGVVDAAVFQPDEARGLVRRVAALVVAPGHTSATIRAALDGAIDPAFMPRPLLIVTALPRNTAGKLPRTALLAALQHHLRNVPGSPTGPA